MNKFKFYFIVSISVFTLFSCSKKEDDAVTIPPREFPAQYTTDIRDIREYLKDYYIEDVSADVDTKITKIPVGGTQPSILSYLNNTGFPKLLIKKVELHDITYEVYYLVLREGIGENPTNVDGVFTAYKGDYLSRKTVAEVADVLGATEFEVNKFPDSFFGLTSVITGWAEIFPQFKTGKSVLNTDGTVTHTDFGAGVMFIPSGLAYYSGGKGSIPSYAPLVFSFKLYAVERYDHDGDGIMSYQEDLDGDDYLRILAKGVDNPDDTDKDGVPDFLDVDDDGDGFSTKLEITKPAGSLGPSKYYPFNPFFVVDDPATPEDESKKSEPKGIPDISGDGTTSDRKRRHLDASAKPPYIVK